jgi:hypothetical protein
VALVVVCVGGLATGATEARAEWRVHDISGGYRWFDDAGNGTQRYITIHQFEDMVKRNLDYVEQRGALSPRGSTWQANGNAATKVAQSIDNLPQSNLKRRILRQGYQWLLQSKAWRVARLTGPLLIGTAAIEIGMRLGPKWLGFDSPKREANQPATRLMDACGGGPSCYPATNSFQYGSAETYTITEPSMELQFAQGNGGYISSVTLDRNCWMSVYFESQKLPPRVDPAGGYTEHRTQSDNYNICAAPEPEPDQMPQIEAFGPLVAYTLPYANMQPKGQPKPYAPGDNVNGGEFFSDQPRPTDAQLQQAARDMLQDPDYNDFNRNADTNDGDDSTPEDDPKKVAIPLWHDGEKGSEYADRLDNLDLNAQVQDVPQDRADPSKGPEEVLSTLPSPGTKVEINSDVQVKQNPATTPEPSGPGWSPPNIASPDLSPLTQIGTPCNVFPFGIFCWLNGALGGWGSNAGCPSFTIPFATASLEMDMCLFNPAMDVFRPILAMVALLCGAYMFAAAAMGFGGGNRDD